MGIDPNEPSDPYVWLETDSLRTRRWQGAQNHRTAMHLAEIPWIGTLEQQISESLRAGALAAPRRAGGRWFRIAGGESGPAIVTSAELDRDETAVVSPSEPDGATLRSFEPAPDGRHVAYELTVDESSPSRVHVAEVASGAVLPLTIPFASARTVAWLPDGSAFFISAGEAPEQEDWTRHLLLCHLDGTVIRESLTSNPRWRIREPAGLSPQVSGDGRWLAAMTSLLDPRPDFIRPLPDGEWRPFLEGIEGRTIGFFSADEYVAVSTHGAPRGRLVRIPIETAGDVETWSELVPESDAVLWEVAQVGDQLVVTRFVDAWAQLAVLHPSAREVETLALPCGSIQSDTGRGPFNAANPYYGGPAFHADPDGVTFVFSSPIEAPAIWRYERTPRRLRRQSLAAAEDHRWVVERHHSRRADGGVVTSTIVRPTDLEPGSSRPTLIYGYGACNVAFVPGQLGVLAPFVEAGGTVVLPHLRGGGEFGERHWHAGRLLLKQHTFDDLYAVAEALAGEGRTSTDLLGLAGISAGGLLAAVAATQRPELFAAVAALAPLTDMLRFGLRPYASVSGYEFGDVRDPQQREALAAYSPYHHVEARPYPRLFIWAADQDIRCPAWYSRKLAARLGELAAKPADIVLRVAPGGEHGAAVAAPSEAAQWLGFLMDALGLEPLRR